MVKEEPPRNVLTTLLLLLSIAPNTQIARILLVEVEHKISAYVKRGEVALAFVLLSQKFAG